MLPFAGGGPSAQSHKGWLIISSKPLACAGCLEQFFIAALDVVELLQVVCHLYHLKLFATGRCGRIIHRQQGAGESTYLRRDIHGRGCFLDVMQGASRRLRTHGGRKPLLSVVPQLSRLRHELTFIPPSRMSPRALTTTVSLAYPRARTPFPPGAAQPGTQSNFKGGLSACSQLQPLSQAAVARG